MRSGVLVVDKPAGVTSFAVVQRIRRALRSDSVGHGGTLDPAATGVLPVCVGEATKLAPFFLGADKAYDAEVQFGVETDTLDADGTVTRRHDASNLTEAMLIAALPSFRGAIRQVPPMHSALKHKGQRLYDLARAGEQVERAARDVFIHELALRRFDAANARADLHVRCSKGTYIRTLADDLGRALGVGAHLAGLRRTSAGGFTLAQAISLEEALSRAATGASLPWISPEAALGHLPTISVDAATTRALEEGQFVAWASLAWTGPAVSADAPVALLRADGSLLAVAYTREEQCKTLRVFGRASLREAQTQAPRSDGLDEARRT